MLRLKLPIIGIGAPAEIFLKPVAEILRTDLVLPEHYAVANAIGAVARSVVAKVEGLVYPRLGEIAPVGYYAQVGQTREYFRRHEEALAFARAEAGKQAEAEAILEGAVSPMMRLEESANGADSWRVRAQAVGNPRLMPS